MAKRHRRKTVRVANELKISRDKTRLPERAYVSFKTPDGRLSYMRMKEQYPSIAQIFVEPATLTDARMIIVGFDDPAEAVLFKFQQC